MFNMKKFFMSFSKKKGFICIPHTLVPLKSHGLDLLRAKELALKLHAHSVHYAHKPAQTRRFVDLN